VRVDDTAFVVFLVEDFIYAYQAMCSSLGAHETDEVITVTFVSVN